MTNTILTTVLILIFLAFYIPYWSYQRELNRFRSRLSAGARVKFLHNKNPLTGKVKKIFNAGRVAVKDESGMIYLTSINNIYPLIGKVKPAKKVNR